MLRKSITALNVALGALFTLVAAGPVGEMFAYRPTVGVQSTLEFAVLFVAVAGAFFFGAWVLLKAWPKMWQWQLVPLIALILMGAMIT